MKSPVVKRSIAIGGHKTSISVEDAFWTSLKAFAKGQGTTVSGLVASIDAERPAGANLSSTIRVYVLDLLRSQIERHETQMEGQQIARFGHRAFSSGGS